MTVTMFYNIRNRKYINNINNTFSCTKMSIQSMLCATF